MKRINTLAKSLEVEIDLHAPLGQEESLCPWGMESLDILKSKNKP